MNLCIIGTGYVGLVTGTCFAEMGNNVICVDINEDKINKLSKGQSVIYEKGLEELIKKNIKEKRLVFSTNIKYALDNSSIVFITVDTPSNEEGKPNLKNLLKVAKDIGENINDYKIIVNKSTAPVGTCETIKNIIKDSLEKRNLKLEFDVLSNPEFLKEGSAIEDFMKPDRIVIGFETQKSLKVLKELYLPFVRNDNPILEMDIKSAEMTKYASNAFLAMKISFINEIANICEILGANINNVRKGMSYDSRIGHKFLFPGIGFGGSCFPKDIKILDYIAEEKGYSSKIIKATKEVNDKQKLILINKILKRFNSIENMKVAIWGLSYKPYTDDIREAPSLKIIEKLLSFKCLYISF
ncbi:MAG: UDP-glucose 6-dehydrogenase [Candidatus Sericytochromatia bacterium]|nr:MAG: UDP-glucose 6-dehydrogenase [Candidatus Sericytochromatia bacterium]